MDEPTAAGRPESRRPARYRADTAWADGGISKVVRADGDECEVDPDVDPLIGGEPFGPVGNQFDPGKLGACFRPWDAVRRQRERVAEVMAGPLWSDTLNDFDAVLRAADERRRGLFVTF